MGSSKVSCVGSRVAAAEQHNRRFPVLAAVDAIAGSVIDAQLENTLAYGLPVATQSRTHAVEPPEEPDPGLAIPQAGEPFAERAAPVRGQGFTDFDVGHCSLKATIVPSRQTGRASSRARVVQYGETSVGSASLRKT